jgi:hypothetical protein
MMGLSAGFGLPGKSLHPKAAATISAAKKDRIRWQDLLVAARMTHLAACGVR